VTIDGRTPVRGLLSLPDMRLSNSSLGLATLLGGLGGATNALMLYTQQPMLASHKLAFCWSVVPAGALHGAVLGLVGVGMAKLALGRFWAVRLAVVAVTGWLAGWLSSPPIAVYSVSMAVPTPFRILQDCPHVGWDAPRTMLRELVRRLQGQDVLDMLWGPYATFGLVSLIYCGLLVSVPRVTARSLAVHVSLAVVSAVMGSLWWWLVYWSSWTSLVHGSVWGALVGAGVWAGRSRSAPTKG
jgi:hypothetical protein